MKWSFVWPTRRSALVATLALALAAACGPRARPPKDVARRLPRPDVTARVAADPVEAARDEALWHVAMLEISRPSVPNGFATYLTSGDPGVRAAAVVAVGRAGEALAWAGGDPQAFVERLAAPAVDRATDVRAAAAFAAGLIGEAAHGQIEAPFAAETSTEVRAKWVRAAGRIAPMTTTTAGNAAEMDLLRAALRDDALAEPAAFALGVYGLRCERAGKTAVVPAAILGRLHARFTHTLGAARAPFAYALWRLKQPASRADLRAGLADPDPRVRAWCARGLGAIKGTHARREVARLLRDSNLWTRVEASRALPKLDDADSSSAVDLVEMLERADPPGAGERKFAAASSHAAVAAAEALGEMHVRATAQALRSRLTTDDPYLFAAVAGSYVKVTGIEGLGDLEETLADRKGAAGWRFRKSIADALAALPKPPAPAPSAPSKKAPATSAATASALAGKKTRTPESSTATLDTRATEISSEIPRGARAMFSALLGDADARVAAAALDSYAEVSGASSRSRLVAALTSSSDVAIVGTAADRLTGFDDAASGSAGPAAAPALVAALARFTSNKPEIAALIAVDAGKLAKESAVPALEAAAKSPDNALMLAAAKALRAMGRTPPTRTAAPATALPLGDFVAAADLTRATLRTSRGEVKLTMRPDLAPLTVWHLAQLSKAGSFRDGSFHRVVPAFVAQGGDPRGDGAGGSGFSIPCELDDLPYERGTVGIALSGRDTGDSQFFLTLTAQPHLESNYTVVGKVSHGLDLIDDLEVGDPIQELTFP